MMPILTLHPSPCQTHQREKIYLMDFSSHIQMFSLQNVFFSQLDNDVWFITMIVCRVYLASKFVNFKQCQSSDLENKRTSQIQMEKSCFQKDKYEFCQSFHRFWIPKLVRILQILMTGNSGLSTLETPPDPNIPPAYL